MASAGGAGFVVGTAAPDQTAAVFRLLPELLASQRLPSQLLVAHAAACPSQLLGAAAFVPQVCFARDPGFMGQCRVLPAFRRRGIGRALLAALAAEARRWDVPFLHGWQPLPAGEPANFLLNNGFRPQSALHDFVGDIGVTRAHCERLLSALRLKGRVPLLARLFPLREAPAEQTARLYASEMGGSHTAAMTRMQETLASPLGDSSSVALMLGDDVLGFLLGGPGDEMMEVKLWVSDSRCRHGWPAVMLLQDFLRRAQALDQHQARYSCNDAALATLNMARKTRAQPVGVRHAYALDLTGAP